MSNVGSHGGTGTSSFSHTGAMSDRSAYGIACTSTDSDARAGTNSCARAVSDRSAD